MKLIKRGAEAALYKTQFLGQVALLKERIPKKYRNSLLDEQIRKQRTKQEAVLLHKAKEAGVRTPSLLKVDKKNSRIWMEWIEGKQLKEELNSKKLNGKKNSVEKFEKQLQKLGKRIAQLHSAGIIHGDLTTSNVLVNPKEMALVDFGLGFFSKKIEDQAVDLLNLKKTFGATHSGLPKSFEQILKSYAKSNPNARTIFRQMEKVEERVRYS